MQTILHAGISLMIAYVVVSLIEYLVHKYAMHSRRLAKSLKSDYLEGAYTNHATLHHNKYYSVFGHEPDEFGREVGIPVGIRNSVMVVGPFILLAWYIDATTGFAMLALTAIHNIAWTAVHKEMHNRDEQRAWWTRTALFGYLTRYHFLHHRQQGKNYNAFYPLWDWILGTLAEERESDRIEMQNYHWTVRPSRNTGN